MHGQTKFYPANADGSIDSNSYRQVIETSGLVITHDRSTDFKNDTAKHFRLFIEANEVKCEFKDPKKPKNYFVPVGELGMVTEDKKIIDYSVPLSGERTPSARVKNSKVYTLDYQVLGYIQ